MGSDKKELNAAFGRRLTSLVDRHPRIPAPNLGRQTYIVSELNRLYGIEVRKQTVGKWLKGEMMPRPPVIRALSDFLGVDAAFLAFNENQKLPSLDIRKQKIVSDGAVHLVIGLMQMAGANCAFVDSDDESGAHFQAIKDGHYIKVHVSVASGPKSKLRFAATPYYDQMVTIGVVPNSQVSFDLFWLNPTLLENEGVKHGSYVQLNAVQDGDSLKVGQRRIEKLTDFTELKASKAG